MSNEIKVLDKGFVRLVDYMGDDSAIVQGARVSYGAGTKTVNEDRGLIRYLMRNRHTSPFELTAIKFHIKMPMFVARQHIRHRTACISGDVDLWFDSPKSFKKKNKSGKYRPFKNTQNVKKFYDKWTSNNINQYPLDNMHLRSVDEETGEIIHTKVKDIWISGEKDVFELELKNGYKIKTSKDHLFYTNKGWKKLKDFVNIKDDNTISYWDSEVFPIVNGVKVHQDKDWLYEKYWNENLNQAEMAKIANVSPATIKKWLVIHNLQDTEGKKSFQKGEKNRTLLKAKECEIASVKYIGKETTYDLEVTGPYHNFIANGFVIHNSVNEISGRYSIMKDEFYVPDKNRIRGQSSNNKQGSSDDILENSDEIISTMSDEQSSLYSNYESYLEYGLARETSRINLPNSLYTEFYWQMNLHNLFHYLKLRMDEHSQEEIRDYANAIYELIKPLYPLSCEAFEDYILKGSGLSKFELEFISKFLNIADKDMMIAELEKQGMNKREIREFLIKINK